MSLSTQLSLVYPCDHFPSCGGCKFRHLPYEQQLEEKKRRVQELFPDVPMQGPFFGDLSHFRSKMEFTFSSDRKGQKFLGLFQSVGRGRVEHLHDCKIAPEGTSEILHKVHTWWMKSSLDPYHPHKDSGSLRTLTIRKSYATKDTLVLLTISGREEYALTRKEIDAFTDLFRSDEHIGVFLIIQECKKGHPTRFYEYHLHGLHRLRDRVGDFPITYSPASFFQPNPKVFQKMLMYAKECLEPKKHEMLLDLCTGIGCFGIFLSPFLQSVVGVEIHPSSVADAKENLEALNIQNMEIVQQDMQQFSLHTKNFIRPDSIIVDPPRAGLDEKTLRYLNESGAQKILYVSCNPKSQVQDIQKLTHYQPQNIALFDQFPHSPHVETIVLLTFAS